MKPEQIDDLIVVSVRALAEVLGGALFFVILFGLDFLLPLLVVS